VSNPHQEDYETENQGLTGNGQCGGEYPTPRCRPEFSAPTQGESGSAFSYSVSVKDRVYQPDGPCVDTNTRGFTEYTDKKYCNDPACPTDNDGDGWPEGEDCDDNDPEHWDDCEFNPDPGSPILIDVAGNGIELTNAANGVTFDLRPDGFRELIPWTSAEGDDAWLVLDRNGNGIIDDGAELFGTFTPQPPAASPNGFLALAIFDENADHWIDARDAIYVQLRVWRDANHDGVSQMDELSTLPAAGVESMSLDYRASWRQDRWGNVLRYRAKIEGPRTPWAYGVHLAAVPRK
jgi:hypothetical protein